MSKSLNLTFFISFAITLSVSAHLTITISWPTSDFIVSIQSKFLYKICAIVAFAEVTDTSEHTHVNENRHLTCKVRDLKIWF